MAVRFKSNDRDSFRIVDANYDTMEVSADNSRDKTRIWDILHTFPVDSVSASRLSVTIRGVDFDLYASISLENPDRALSAWLILSSSGMQLPGLQRSSARRSQR